jgi:ABC-type multidrug transport system fused ATPase/permease subunit
MGGKFLSSNDVKRGWLLSGLILVSNAFEMVALASVLPFVNIVIQPSAMHTNRHINRLYNWLAPSSESTFIVWMGIGVVLFMLAGALFRWIRLYALNLYVAACQSRLSKSLLDELIHAPYAWFLSRNYSVLSRVVYEDCVIWARSFVQRLLLMFSDVIIASISLGLVMFLSPKTGLVSIFVVGLLAYACFSLTRPILAKWAARKRAAMDKSVMAVTQAMAGIRDIKLSSRESYFTGLFGDSYGMVSGGHARQNIWHETPSIMMLALGQMTLVLIALAFSLKGMDSGAIAAQLTLLIVVTSRAVPAVNGLSSSFADLWNAYPYVHGIQELRSSIQAVIGDAPRSTKQATTKWESLSFSNVTFSYPLSPVPALKNVSLQIEKGKCYGIIGRSAAGKSTLVDLLVGLLNPSDGAIKIDSDALSTLDIKSWQRQIGYVPQTPFLTDDTIRGNIAFGVPPEKVDDALVKECLRKANLEDVLKSLELGLDTPLGDRGNRISGGQRQRIAIARALYNRPNILVFDEATSALDAITEREILSTLDQLRGHVTLIVIAHRLSTIVHCDRIFLFEQGELSGEGTFDDLKANNNLFQDMLSGRDASKTAVNK